MHVNIPFYDFCSTGRSNDNDCDAKDRFLFSGSRSNQNTKTLPIAVIIRLVAILAYREIGEVRHVT